MKDKVVIITGGSSGIGKALATVYATAGAKVVVTGRDESKLAEMAGAFASLNLPLVTYKADVSKEEDNIYLVKEVVDRFGGIDVLINNAGISMRALFEDISLDVFKKVMDINFYGTLYATKYALPYILKSKGSVIAVSSINGYRGTPARTAYTASKYAMNGFMEALRTEVMKRGVHIMVACPGFTSSNIRNAALTADGTPQGTSPREEQKMMTAEAVAMAILEAHKKKKRDLVLSREGKMAVFLNKWMPGLMDQIVYKHMAKEKDSPMK